MNMTINTQFEPKDVIYSSGYTSISSGNTANDSSWTYRWVDNTSYPVTTVTIGTPITIIPTIVQPIEFVIQDEEEVIKILKSTKPRRMLRPIVEEK